MWKQVIGYENLYEVNEYGQVKSVARKGHDGRIVNEKILKSCEAGKGYLSVCLRKDGKTVRHYIHRLVCEAFIPRPISNEALIVNHIDGNKKNNHYTNLEWVTYTRNSEHSYQTGLRKAGEEFYNSKLTTDQIVEIRTRGKYTTYQAIADQYGVTKATIRDVLINRTWNSVHSESSNDYPQGVDAGVIPVIEVPHDSL